MPDQSPVCGDLPVPIDGPPDLLIIAGEHSGDEHAAKLLTSLMEKRPGLRVASMGGPALQAAGAQLIYDMTAVSIVGFVEVVRKYGFFKELFGKTLDWIEQHRPRHICLVDYPGFNLRLAEQLAARGLSKKGGGCIGLSYYIGPQVWAWKAGRRFRMEAVLDRLGVIFPFEVDCYKDTSLPVECVGHPFMGEDESLPFSYDADGPVLLLPGSRSAAVMRIFPVLLEGFARARQKKTDLKALVIYPDEKIKSVLEMVLQRYPLLREHVSFSIRGGIELPARAVLMSSGTMSLAVALSGIPGAITYRLNPFSYLLGRILVKLPYIGIANILLNRSLHKEYIQHHAKADRLAAELIQATAEGAAEEAAEAAKELAVLLSPKNQRDVAAWLLEGMEAPVSGEA